MSKSVTVQFDDGTSHVYDNVPDEVSDAQVQQRASSEFGKAATVSAAPQAAPPAAPGAPAAAGPNLGQQIVGAAQIPFQMAVEHPAVPAAAYGAYKAYGLANKYVQGQNAAAQGATEAARIQAEAAADVARQRAATQASHQALQYAKAGLPMPAAPVTAPVAPTMTAPPVAQVAQAVEQPGIMQRGADIASKMRQFAASKVLAPAGEALGAAGKALAPLAPIARVAAGPIGTGAQMLFHSGSTGPQVPMQGPYRGMEINPNTGRPWTPQELAQINGG